MTSRHLKSKTISFITVTNWIRKRENIIIFCYYRLLFTVVMINRCYIVIVTDAESQNEMMDYLQHEH